MKRFFYAAAIFLITLSLLPTGFIQAGDIKAEWENMIVSGDWHKFSKNLEGAVKSENAGLQISAMQMVIKYSDKVNINNSVTSLVRVYRSNVNERIRQLALITIHSIQNDWALGIVKRDLGFERSPELKKLMIAVVNNNTREVTSIYQNDVMLSVLK